MSSFVPYMESFNIFFLIHDVSSFLITERIKNFNIQELSYWDQMTEMLAKPRQVLRPSRPKKLNIHTIWLNTLIAKTLL